MFNHQNEQIIYKNRIIVVNPSQPLMIDRSTQIEN